MATKQPTQLCYQVNGGTCRNKVSAKNSYICAAGHKGVKNIDAQRKIAKNPSIDREAIQILLNTEDNSIRWDLATNPSIDRDVQQFLFDTKDEWTRRDLAKNPSLDHDIAQALFDTGDEWVKRDLATNPSIDREMAITLAKDGHAPIGYLKNKSITELCERENISLLNEHPEEFGRAYLDHLLGSDEDLDQMKALLCYSYDCYRKASGSNPKGYRERILAKYPNDEEIKYLLSGD